MPVERVLAWKRCSGEAHTNPYIDHCMICFPWWDAYPYCTGCRRKLRETKKFYICPGCGTRWPKEGNYLQQWMNVHPEIKLWE